jgi:cytochrome c556
MLSKPFISVVLLYVVCLPPTATAEREQAEMPEFVSRHLMATMRNHLEALEDISRLLSERRYDKAADLVEQHLGMSSIEMHYEKHVGKYMPSGMRSLATEMHGEATRFAVSARNAEKAGGSDEMFAALADVMGRCVACHSAYRAQ